MNEFMLSNLLLNNPTELFNSRTAVTRMSSELVNFIDITEYFTYEIVFEPGSIKISQHCDRLDGQVSISGRKISLLHSAQRTDYPQLYPSIGLHSLMLCFSITELPL
jgi:hypothetical protein